MYHVTGTAITVSLLYLVSFIFQRSGIYTLSTHRKIWNTVLAVSFLITALGGILTALQINYKWDIGVINSILKWHVETGVCLGVTGIFHFIWHLSYFKKLFSERENRSEQSIENSNPSSITSNLFVVGFTSTSVQLLLIREILNISGGYELITGIFLGSWLIASAAGAFIAGRSKLNNIPRINLIFSVSPAISILFMFILTSLFLK
ncbi:MAG: hypothetical protein JXN62_11445, partial [Bacteroidales bacterium]|nr:hypothetical protein [Bacteroidales bacterium]